VTNEMHRKFMWRENVSVTLRKNIKKQDLHCKNTVARVINKYLVSCNSQAFKRFYLESVWYQLIPYIK
jgi:hypothetical protein